MGYRTTIDDEREAVARTGTVVGARRWDRGGGRHRWVAQARQGRDRAVGVRGVSLGPARDGAEPTPGGGAARLVDRNRRRDPGWGERGGGERRLAGGQRARASAQFRGRPI